MFKQKFSIILATALVVCSLTACGTTSPASSALSPLASSPVSADSPSASASASSTGTQAQPDVLTMLINDKVQFDYEDAVVKELEKRLNIKFQVEVPPSANYVEKVRLIISSGKNLPDVVQSLPSDMVESAAKSNIIVPLDSYLDATTHLKNELDPQSIKAAMVGGKVYAVPKNSWPRASGIYLREDWLNSLGITLDSDGSTIPLAKFEEIMTKFTFDDPDKNGQNDTFGFGTPLGTGWKAHVPLMIQAAFGAGKGLTKTANGEYQDYNLHEGWDKYKESAAYYRSLIEKKVVDPEVFTAKSEQFRQRFYQGKVGSACNFGSSQSYANFIPAMRNINPEAELIWVNSLTGPNGDYKMYTGGANTAGSYYVTSSCKDPSVFFRLMDYIASPEGRLLVGAGIEGMHYTLENGEPIRKTEEQKKLSEQYRSMAIVLMMVRDTKNPDWYYDIPNMDADTKTRVTKYINQSLDVSINDDLGLTIPSFDGTDQVNELLNALEQALIKYLLGEYQIEQLDAARNKLIESQEYKQYVQLVTDTYANQ